MTKLTASDAQVDDVFGENVAISGDTAFVGASFEDAGGTEAGATYVFQRNEGGVYNWGEVKKTTASDAQADDRFGGSVAISGGTAVVGASLEDAAANNAGAAYVFQGPVTATIVVDSSGDTNARDSLITLREAILLATGGLSVGTLDVGEADNVTGAPGPASADTIVSAAPGAGLTLLTSALPPLSTGNDTLDGGGPGTVIDGQTGSFTCFDVTSNGNVLKGATVRGCTVAILVQSGAQNNTIGGTTAAERAVIIDNSTGIRITGSGTNNNDVLGSYIGVASDGVTAVPNGTGVTIEEGAQANTIGGTTSGERNVISGNTSFGIFIEDIGTNNNTVEGNFIGTNAGGNAALGNGLDGILIQNTAQSNTIGGSSSSSRNVISGNARTGVLIASASNNFVRGNYVGTDSTGTAALGNLDGISIGGAPTSGNVVGGTTVGERNVISGNTATGVALDSATATAVTVSGNYIGLNASGTAAVPNVTGVLIGSGADNNTIGGTTAGERNVISGNGSGVEIMDSGTTGNTVRGNYIGTNAAGTAAVLNSIGVWITDGAQTNTIGGVTGTTPGGPCTGACNLISGNALVGVLIEDIGTDENVIKGNYIGTDAGGAGALANGYGVLLDGFGNTIGGIAVGEGNVIAFNILDGVCVPVATSTGNSIRGNSIHSNTLLGIDLVPTAQSCFTGTATPNDTGDTDSGPNNLMNFPVITDVTFDGVQTTVTGTLDTDTAPETVAVDVYTTDVADGSGFGEGREYVGTATPAPITGDWTLVVSGFPSFPIFTATATSANPSTSEFSATFTPSVGPGLPLIEIALEGDPTPIGGTFTSFGAAHVPSTTGDVPFWATVSGGSAPEALFNSSGGVITKLVAVGDASPIGTSFTDLGEVPITNEGGDVAFWAVVDGATEGIFLRLAAGTILKIAATGDTTPVGGTYVSFKNPNGELTQPAVMNNLGDISFWATVVGGSAAEGVFLRSGESPNPIAKVVATGDSTPVGGTFSTFVVGGAYATVPIVTNNRQVTFWSAISGASATQGVFRAQGVFQPSGITITKIAATGEGTPLGGTYVALGQIPSPNDGGQVGFWAVMSGSSADVCVNVGAPCAAFLSSSGVVTKVIAAGDTGPPGVGGTINALSTIPLINGSGQLTSWVGITSGLSTEALVRVSESVMENVSAVGNSPPSGGTFDNFVNVYGNPQASVINNLGQVAFAGEVDDGGVIEGIFVTEPPPFVVFEEAAIAGDTAPGTGGGTFDNNFDLDINGGGQAVFRNTVSGGTATSGLFRFFAGSAVEAIAVQGDEAPMPTGGDFSSFGPPVNNDDRYVAATAVTTGGAGNGLFRFFAGSATELAYTGANAPGTSRFFAGFADPSIDNFGNVVAHVDLADTSGGAPNGEEALYLFRFFAGAPELLATTGNPAPDLTSRFFAGFFQPTIADNGDVVATVILDGGDQAVYRFFAGQPVGDAELVAVADPSVPAPDLTSRFFAGFGERPSINLTGDITYQATLDDTRQALFRFFAGTSTTRLLALQGESVPTAVGGTFGAFGDPAINLHGQVVARAGIIAGSASEGLFLFFRETSTSSVAISEIVLQGQTTPDGEDTYGGTTPVFPFIAYSSTAKIVYVANLVRPSQGVYIASLDFDEDGVLDYLDNCPLIINTDQNNTDKALAAGGADVVADELGNACDDDIDGDGVLNGPDPCAVIPDCDGDGFNDGLEVYMGTEPQAACAATSTPDNEGLPDYWPFDFNDNQRADISDVLGYIPVFNSFFPIAPYEPRRDLNANGGITLGDVLSYIPVFNQTCTP